MDDVLARYCQSTVVMLKRLLSFHGCSTGLGACLQRASTPTSNSQPVVCSHAAFLSADEALSFSDIQTRANLPDEDVIRILHSLSCGKYKVGALSVLQHTS